MDFLSVNFLIFIFITFVIFYIVGFANTKAKRFIPQWSVLLVASLVFYAFANWKYLIFLLISTLVSYFGALFVQYKMWKRIPEEEVPTYQFEPAKVENHLMRRKYENIITAITIVINVGILAVLKYYNFFVDTVNSIFHTGIGLKNFLMPLGISFYTFSLIAYNVDVCKRETKAELNPLKFLLFVSYFPRIIQGPISSYDKLKEDGLFSNHNFLENNYLNSVFRISVGLVKKLAIANVLNLYVNSVYSNISFTNGAELILISIFYTIQLYCDFSGFMDIAIGISGLFEIKLEENFNLPYISCSIQEFWRRWHITLGTWLKKYIYIPLGGNRVKPWKWVINTLIVWFISGLWHGANWTFIVWGLLHGVVLVIEGLPKQIRKSKGLEQKITSKPKWYIVTLRLLLTFALVNLGWIFFRSESIDQAFKFIKGTITFRKGGNVSVFENPNLVTTNWLLAISCGIIVILVSYVFAEKCIPIMTNKFKFKGNTEIITKYVLTTCFISLSLFMFFFMRSIGGGESSFIYFEF